MARWSLRTKLVDASSPLVYGYTDNLAVYCFECTIYNLSNLANGGGQRPTTEPERTTGRGTKDDPDLPQGRPAVDLPELPKAEPWEALPFQDEHLEPALCKDRGSTRPPGATADNHDVEPLGTYCGFRGKSGRAHVRPRPAPAGAERS